MFHTRRVAGGRATAHETASPTHARPTLGTSARLSNLQHRPGYLPYHYSNSCA